MSLNSISKSPIATLLGAVALCFFLNTASAEQIEQINGHVVHYNTLNTNLLSPDVARSYGIQRSANRALLNIAVLKPEGDVNTPVTARISASATNLAGQRRVIDLQEIHDQGAIYYIGTFRIHDQEQLNFRIQVQPEGSTQSREFTFRQQFFTG